MASPAACAQYAPLAAAVRVSTAPRRRPASSFSLVRIPPAARTAPRSLSASLSVLRPRAHRGASDRESAGDAAGFGFSPSDPAVEDSSYDIAPTTDLISADADADYGLVPFVEDPFELVATKGLGQGAHGKGDANLVLAEVAATTGLGDGAHDVDDGDRIMYPSRMTKRELDEYEHIDFSRAAINERFRLASKEAKAAVMGAIVGVVRPLRELVDDVRSLDSVFDAQEFQIGMPFAAIMTCMGMYQLWKLSPSTCIDVAMHYAFYKLSVIAADVRRRGFSPDWIIRIKFGVICAGIIIAVIAKEHGNKTVPLDFIRGAIFIIYGVSVGWDVKGHKKYASSFLSILLHEHELRKMQEHEHELRKMQEHELREMQSLA